jgi:hypothetical protein
MKRRPHNIPAIFLFALSLGMWLGASIHVASQTSIQPNGCANCVRLVSLVNHSKTRSAQLKSAPVAVQKACAACLAGALVQDAPSSACAVLPELIQPADAAPLTAVVRLVEFARTLPPERGPPA